MSRRLSTSITKSHAPGKSSSTRLWDASVGFITFAYRTLGELLKARWDTEEIWHQPHEIGWRSTPLIIATGIVVGVVLAELIGTSLVNFGAVDSVIPAELSRMMFREMGPLLTGILISGRVGAAIGAELAVLRHTEQIDALESFAIDSFSYLVITRVVACIIALPILATVMNFSELAGGYLWVAAKSEMSFQLYAEHVFDKVGWGNYILPTLMTAVFGFVVGTVASYFGYTVDEHAAGVRRAAMYSVVLSCLLVIASSFILNQLIPFWFSGGYR